MASKEEITADAAAVEDIRAKFGNAEAAKLAADLYKLRRTPAPTFAGFPRWAIVFVVLWVAALETADKLPRLLLAYPAYEAQLAEYEAKMMQPDLTQAQLVKARNEAKASDLQPDLIQSQLSKARNDAKTSAWQVLLTAAQSIDAQNRAYYLPASNLHILTNHIDALVKAMPPTD